MSEKAKFIELFGLPWTSIFWFLLLFKESPKWMLTESNIKREKYNIKNSGILHLADPKPLKSSKEYEPSVLEVSYGKID